VLRPLTGDFGFAAAIAALVSAAVIAQSPALPDGPGKDRMVQACGRCHEPERSAALRLTREGWDKVIADMVARGAVLADADRAAVLDYLATQFPGEAAEPLDINAATNIDLEAVAGLTRKESAALREWLKQNGPCKALGDLKAAPIDYRKIDDRKALLMCMVAKK
jgi:competence protein ComEA